jgi:ABC-type spermidine/putrescine transport system permease subunit II
MKAVLGWFWRGSVLGVLAFAIFGPLANLLLWAVAIQWYFPHKLPLTYGLRYWDEVFKPTSDASASLGTSIVIAVFTVIVCLLLAVPAGYGLGRRLVPARGLILLVMLLPLAFPSVAVYLNIARLFYMVGLNGTIAGSCSCMRCTGW